MRKKARTKRTLLVVSFCVCFLFLIVGTTNLKADCPASSLTGKVDWKDLDLFEHVPGGNIQPGTCVTINFKLESDSYQWTIQENDDDVDDDFYFNSPTNEQSVDICLSEAACGSATVTLELDGGNTYTDFVLATEGHWADIKPADCPFDSPVPANNGSHEALVGKFKVAQTYTTGPFASASVCENSFSNCAAFLSWAEQTWPNWCGDRRINCLDENGMGCVQCIKFEPRMISDGYRPHYVKWPCAAWQPCLDGGFLNYDSICTYGFALQEWKCEKK